MRIPRKRAKGLLKESVVIWDWISGGPPDKVISLYRVTIRTGFVNCDNVAIAKIAVYRDFWRFELDELDVMLGKKGIGLVNGEAAVAVVEATNVHHGVSQDLSMFSADFVQERLDFRRFHETF
jgi:hypothetical protein